MLITTIAATLLALQGTAAAEKTPALADASATEKAAKTEKITDRNHPEYMRCRREAVIGSRAKKRKICMTNREWALAARKGNEGTRSIVEDAQSGLNGNN